MNTTTDMIQEEDDELLESLKRATLMIIKLNDENQRLVKLIGKLKAEIDRLRSETSEMALH